MIEIIKCKINIHSSGACTLKLFIFTFSFCDAGGTAAE